MAFSSGSAANVNDLIDAIRVFFLANSWTSNAYATDGTGKRLHLQKSTDIFVNFRSCVNENPNQTGITDLESASGAGLYALWLNGSTGYNAANAWYSQPSAPYIYLNPPTNTIKQYRYQGIAGLSGGMNYWLFAFNDCGYVVTEYPTGTFAWLGFGKITKIGDWTGGQFTFGKHQPTVGSTTGTFSFLGSSYHGFGSSRGQLYLSSFDGKTGWCSSAALTAESGSMIGLRIGDGAQKMASIIYTTPNLFDSEAQPDPVEVYVTRDGSNFTTTTPFSLLGYLEGLLFVNIRNLKPGGTYSKSTDDYTVFSFHTKIETNPANNGTGAVGTLGFGLKSN